MIKAINRIGKFLIRLIILWIVDALSLAAAAWLMPGMSFQVVAGVPLWLLVVAAAGLLAIINLVLRPIVLRLALPLGWVATLVIGFLVTAVALWITAWMMPGFDVGIVAGLIGGIVIAFFNTILIDILDVNVENSWYQNRSERLAKKTPFAAANEPGRGLMMVEIDGLSYWHIKQAIADGLMPTLQEMMDKDGYVLTRVECGLPSMTSACQAGIMFGDNNDIPAYRWYDKSKKKLYVSADDASELNGRYAPWPWAHAPGFEHHEHDERRCRDVALHHGQHVRSRRSREAAPRPGHRPVDAGPLLPDPCPGPLFRRSRARAVAGLAAEAQACSAASQPAEGLVSLRAGGDVFADARYLGQPRHPGYHARRAVHLHALPGLRRSGPPFGAMDE